MLDNDETPGAYIYYLGTLHNKPFHQIMPSSRSFEGVRCNVEGLGMGEFLVRLTQLFVKCVKKRSNLHLAINKTSVYIKFYKRLKFKVNNDAEEACQKLGDEIRQCVSLEATDISVFRLLCKWEQIKPHKLNARTLIRRHCDSIERCHSKFPTVSSDSYLSLMRDR